MAEGGFDCKRSEPFLYLKSAHWSFHFLFGIMKLPNTRRVKYENDF